MRDDVWAQRNASNPNPKITPCLSTLRKTSQDVTELQKDLEITMEKVEEKKAATDKLIEEMSVQQADAQVQEEAAQLEAEKANEESEKAMAIESSVN